MNGDSAERVLKWSCIELYNDLDRLAIVCMLFGCAETCVLEQWNLVLVRFGVGSFRTRDL
jgi:hypothetical protein